MFTSFFSKRDLPFVACGALAAALGGGLATLLGATLLGAGLLAGLCLLVWVLLVIADRHFDPLWLGLAVAWIATVALFPPAFARLLCDDNSYCYAVRAGAAARFKVAGAVTITLIAAILVRAVLRAIRAYRERRE